MPQVRIRRIRNHSEFRECERLQRTVWGNLSVSSEALLVTQKYGGVVLGAFADAALAGFLYAFIARRNGRLIHWSHMMAVAPGHRDRGLGFKMKLAHRALALKQGVKSICWTFDPLQSRNATLNIARLGARPEEYIADCYGHFPSKIEGGLPTDRFVVSWQLDSPALRIRKSGSPRAAQPASFAVVNDASANSQGFLENRRLRLNLHDPNLIVEIPPNTDAMRSADKKLAMRWRLDIRKIFQKYLADGYSVQSFLPPGAFAHGRCFYTLRRVR